MTTINDLAVTSSVSSDDKVPLWQNSNGVTRAMPISVLDSRYLTAEDVAALAASPTTERFISDALPNPTGLPTFTAGSTTAITLQNEYFSAANIEVFFDANYQGIEQYSLVGFGLSFTAPIPLGVQNIYVHGGSTRVVGTPGQQTVTDDMIATGTKISNRMADEVSVTDFGADPLGVIDSTAAFNSAASASGASGMSVYVPGGTYKLNSQVMNGTASWRLSPNAKFTGIWPYFFRGFYTNINVAPFGNGSNVHRLNDRVMIGTATKYDGKNTPTATDWINTLFPDSNGVSAFGYMLTNATSAVGAPLGQLAMTVYGRTSDSGAGGNGVIGVSSCVVNDNTIGVGSTGWGYYATIVKGVGANGPSTLGMEIDITNLGGEVDVFPNQLFSNGVSAAMWLAAGGELPSQTGASGLYTFNKVSAAIGIFANQPGPFTNCVFEKGIVFGKGGISSGIAMALPPSYGITWFNDGNSTTSAIFSTATLSDQPHIQKIQFSDFGTLMVDGAGRTQFRVLNGVSNASNYLMASASPAGTGPTLTAAGSDANIDLQFVTQGTGTLRFGTYTAGTVTQAGYITIKDAGGTVRRLLVG